MHKKCTKWNASVANVKFFLYLCTAFETHSSQKQQKLMLDAFYQTHKYLVEHVDFPVRRLLMDEIDWRDRLIGIKGSRGCGKTSFLLQYAKEHFGGSRECLYVNFNNLYFTEHSLVEFADEFVRGGGKTLLIDQTFKMPNWSEQLMKCYYLYTDLHIVFSASPVMRLVEDNKDIGEIVSMYNLRGFSFREYLNLQAGTSFAPLHLEDIIDNHHSLAQMVCDKVHPLWYFADYLQHGYYPFSLENHYYMENLLKVMNMMLEVDVLIIKQIDVSYLQKIRSLLHIFMQEAPCGINVSKLADRIDTSRATAMNYIKYLKDARLLNLLYTEDKQFPMKPQKVYLQNTNLIYSNPHRQVSQQVVAETFFYNAMHARHKINASSRNAMFLVDGKYYFDVLEREPNKLPIRLTAVGGCENTNNTHLIPLWLFGFLY